MTTAAFPKILQLGDKMLADLYDGDVEITEKIDGSQFGFGMIDGQLVCRSKGRELDLDDVDKLFSPAVAHVKSVADRLPRDVMFYGETLAKPRHSTVAYDRTPRNHIALFGAVASNRHPLDYAELGHDAERFDVDIVPLLHFGPSDARHTIGLLERESYLGGAQIEGVVVKRYVDWMFLGRILIPIMAGKYVSEAFKEVHKKDWAKLNTASGGVEGLKQGFRTEARWIKAVNHLRESGTLTDSVRDIGAVVKEVQADIEVEEKQYIQDQLYNLFRGDIMRTATAGLAEWYKQRLALDVREVVAA